MGDFCGKSWYLSSLLVIGSYNQYLGEFFSFSFRNVGLIHIIKDLLFLSVFSVLLFLCINKLSVIIIIVRRIDVVILVFKPDWVKFRSMTRNCSFGRTWSLCINILVDVFDSWYIYAIVPKEPFSCCILIYEQWSPEISSLQFSITRNQ